ncbi:MAG: desulfoferrodoxin [Clostridiales bacterium]|jgi:superoxide reductase|nr:desulfoferrodoxin [Clostridiales bacterium]
MTIKFYVCKHCGNMIAFLENSGVPVICCGEEMSEQIPQTADSTKEKHVPVIDIEKNKVTVTVGSVDHPMIEEHFIKWICLQTKQGNQRKFLNPGEKPSAVFLVTEGDEVEAAYEYCNIHGLWKATV